VEGTPHVVLSVVQEKDVPVRVTPLPEAPAGYQKQCHNLCFLWGQHCCEMFFGIESEIVAEERKEKNMAKVQPNASVNAINRENTNCCRYIAQTPLQATVTLVHATAVVVLPPRYHAMRMADNRHTCAGASPTERDV
jgi:hypothetical protein